MQTITENESREMIKKGKTKVRNYFQSIKLAPPGTDCKTNITLDIVLTKNLVNGVIGNYIVEDDRCILLTEENINNYINKSVCMRSPLFCTSDQICNICAGERYHKIGATDNRVIFPKRLKKKIRSKFRIGDEIYKIMKLGGRKNFIVWDLIVEDIICKFNRYPSGKLDKGQVKYVLTDKKHRLYDDMIEEKYIDAKWNTSDETWYFSDRNEVDLFKKTMSFKRKEIFVNNNEIVLSKKDHGWLSKLHAVYIKDMISLEEFILNIDEYVLSLLENNIKYYLVPNIDEYEKIELERDQIDNITSPIVIDGISYYFFSKEVTDDTLKILKEKHSIK